MFLHTDVLLPYLKEKVRLLKSDASRHLLCPQCCVRTKLNTLGDGRRKCTICGKKFNSNKVSDKKKLQECAEILLCFCIDFPPRRTAHITQYSYTSVMHYYTHFRELSSEDDSWKDAMLQLAVQKKHPDPYQQARDIIERMPADFLSNWSVKKED